MPRVDFKAIRHEQRTLAGVTVPVAVTPRFKKQGYVGRISASIKSLLDGMRLTFGYLISPSKVVTRQYPENRATLKFPERYRASLRMNYDENGWHTCTGCRLCEKACPNASIIITTRKDAVTGDRELDRYVWRLDSCVFCNACVEACPFGAIEMTHAFENAVYDRRLLVYTLNRYAGPTAGVLAEHEDAATRAKMMTPRDPYGGNVPVNGYGLPNLPALRVTPVADEQPEPVENPEGGDA